MALSWLAVEARTGRILADLPLLEVSGAVKQTIGRYESLQATLPINQSNAPPDWVRATQENAAHLILCEDNPLDLAHPRPLIGYRINRRRRSSADFITLDLMTIESYFDRRYIRGSVNTSVGQNAIIAGWINSFILDGVGGLPGLPIRVQYTTPGAGFIRTRTIADQENKTVYSAMQDLMGVISGPEWYVGWEWQSSPERITPVLYVGDRIGTAAGVNGPAATFEFPSNYGIDFEFVTDMGSGVGANDIMAYSTGQGTSVIQSPHSTSFDGNQLTLEHRWTPSTSITDVASLTAYAQKSLPLMKDGGKALSMISFVDGAPQFGTEWGIGDDLGYVLGGVLGTNLVTGQPKELIPSIPGGMVGVARCAGWERTLDVTPSITPVLISASGAFNA